VPVHLLVMTMGRVQPVHCEELRPALDQATARRPGHHLEHGLGAGRKDGCSRQRHLVQADQYLAGVWCCRPLEPRSKPRMSDTAPVDYLIFPSWSKMTFVCWR